VFQSCNRCYKTERTLKSRDQKEISLSRKWGLQDQKCWCLKDVSRAKITTPITTHSIPIIPSVLSRTKFTIMAEDTIQGVISTGFISRNYYFKFRNSEQYRDGTGWGRCHLDKRGWCWNNENDSEQKTARDPFSFPLCLSFFFSSSLSLLLHKRKLVSRLWRHFRMTGASDEVITEQLC